MLEVKRFFVASALICVLGGVCFADKLEDNWKDFLHYTQIGRPDLAEGHAKQIIESNPDPVRVLELAESNANGYRLLLRMKDHSEKLGDVSSKILEIIEEGRFAKRIDPDVISKEIKKLSTTIRARAAANKRLHNAGEYAVPLMLEALSDPSRKDEYANIAAAFPKIGRDAIRPLATALETQNIAVKLEIIRALGEIGYSQALPYLKYVIENSDNEQIIHETRIAISKIEKDALKVTAAELFFQQGEAYYCHAESLRPRAADIANIWLWDAEAGKLKRVAVDNGHFAELMSMRCCEWALKADETTGKAIALWIAAFFKAEAAVSEQPDYFGVGHPDAMTYATTAGPEYLHAALDRAIEEKNADVALGTVEALAANAGEKSLMYRVGSKQPLVKALSFSDTAVKYSAALAIGGANPASDFAGSNLVIENLAKALAGAGKEELGRELSDLYALRAVDVMYKLALTRNSVIDLTRAREELISVTKVLWPEMQVKAGRVLSLLKSPDAQRGAADMALREENPLDVRIKAFESLAVSAKQNANLLTDDQIDSIYALISSDSTDAELRSAAASAYGALNLPSKKVKELILDQSK